MSMESGPDNAGLATSDSRRLGGGAIAALGGGAVLLIFMIQNTEKVTVDFLFWSFTWPIWLLTLAAALVGARWCGSGSVCFAVTVGARIAARIVGTDPSPSSRTGHRQRRRCQRTSRSPSSALTASDGVTAPPRCSRPSPGRDHDQFNARF